MPEESDPPQPPPPEQPTLLGNLAPDEMLARGMQSVKMTSGATGAWEPPTMGEAARLFPGYEVLRLLGRGGMGAVYQARQIELDRLVAIKLLPLEISVDKDFADRFRREARAMAELNHPHIIAVYDFGTTREGHLFFVMEFVEGANLYDIIHQVGLDGDQALSIAEQVCTALAYAHGKGIVHRDIKPANVMIDTESHVKVADFGLARLTDPGAADLGHTMTGTVMGTPDYMAPEQSRGMNVDHRADIYSLGVMLYEMLCREVPKGIFDPPSHRTECDARIDQIVIRAMQQAPDRRFQSTQEMKAHIVTARQPVVVPDVEDVAPAPSVPKSVPPKPATPAPVLGPPKKPITPKAAGAGASPEPALPEVPKMAVMQAIPPPEAKKSKLPLYGGVAAAVALALGAILFFLVPKLQRGNTPGLESSASPAPHLEAAASPAAAKPSNNPATSTAPHDGAKVAPSVTSAPPASATSPARQTIDLLALADPSKDLLKAEGYSGVNQWSKSGGRLVFKSADGKSGKIGAPVSLNKLRDYEVEAVIVTTADNTITLDFPTSPTSQATLDFNVGSRVTLAADENRKTYIIGAWPIGTGLPVKLAGRIRADSDGVNGTLSATVNGLPVGSWHGPLAKLGKPAEQHPDFPGQMVPALFTFRGDREFSSWKLRVFEGEARVLRPAAAPSGSIPPATEGWVSLLPLINPQRDKVDGEWSVVNGELQGNGGFARLALPYTPPEEYDFRIRFTRQNGTRAVSQHLAGGRQDVMWLMSGFDKSVWGLEQVGGAKADANATTLKMPLENGRRYESLVKVRRARVRVEVDGKPVVDYPTDWSDFSMNSKWAFPDPKKLGVGCQQPTVFHSIEVLPEGFRPLFDGQTFAGWGGYNSATPSAAWRVQDGAALCTGDRSWLVTKETFGDFELRLEWKVGPNGNGGIFFHMLSGEGNRPLSAPEFQLCARDVKDTFLTGTLYNVLKASEDASLPTGEWNTARLVVRGGRCEHWVNEKLVLSYDLKSEEWKKLWQASKMNNEARYGQAPQGAIGLQGWTGEVAYRNIRIRSLGGETVAAPKP